MATTTTIVHLCALVLMALVCTFATPAAAQVSTRQPRVEENPCRGQPDGSYQKHPLGCAYFFLCIKGNVNTMKCPQNLAFNPDNPPCDRASTVGCVLDATTARPTWTTTALAATTTATSTAPVPTAGISTSTSSTSTTLRPPPTTTTTTTIPVPTTTSTTTPTTTPQPTTTTPAPKTTTTPRAPLTTTTSTILPTLPQLPTFYYPPTPLPTLPPTLPSSARPTNPPTSTTPTYRPPAPTSTQSPVESDLITCPAVEDETSVRFVSSNENCSQYYICYHNHPLRMHCADGLHWNHRAQQCDLPERAACTIRTVASSFPVCPRDIAVGLYAHPHRCDQFLYCAHGLMSVQQCPFYYHFDVELRRCALRTVAKCGAVSATTTSGGGFASSGGSLPHVPEYEYGENAL